MSEMSKPHSTYKGAQASVSMRKTLLALISKPNIPVCTGLQTSNVNAQMSYSKSNPPPPPPAEKNPLS